MKIIIDCNGATSSVRTDEPMDTMTLVGHLTRAVHGILKTNMIQATNLSQLPDNVAELLHEEIGKMVDTALDQQKEKNKDQGG